MIDRRRFLTIAAAVAALPLHAETWPGFEWQGLALGARARILIDHPDAPAITAEAAAEIARLEGIFSLYRDSALTRLNRDGRLDAPPPELLECLALCDLAHRVTGGLFDPTVQPLWAAYAETAGAPSQERIAAALALVGWTRVDFDEERVTLAPGMALTLNGVAQGFIADRIAALLRGRGLTNILVDTGELAALGPRPDGQPWPVSLTSGARLSLDRGGLASSSVTGTTFDAAGSRGHILDPRTGAPGAARWRLVTVAAPQAGLADALSTAFCLMGSEAEMRAALPADATLTVS